MYKCMSSRKKQPMSISLYVKRGVHEKWVLVSHTENGGTLRKHKGLILPWHCVHKDDRGLLDTSKSNTEN